MAPSINHYTEVHFEDLVADTEGVLRRVCEFIDLEFDPVMLDYHERAEGRLAEKARELPRKNRPNQSGRGAARQPQAGEGAAALGPDRHVAREDDAGGDRRVRGGRRRFAGRARLRAGHEAGEARAAEKGVAADARADLSSRS